MPGAAANTRAIAKASTMTSHSPVPSARIVATATLAMFLAAFALLVFQLRSGRDPAIGAGTALVAPRARPRRRAAPLRRRRPS